jgi:co-chaperonin GroES (HSP10)
MKPTANRLKVSVIEEKVKIENIVSSEKKKEAIPVILPTVKGNTVLKANVLDVGPDVKEISKGDTVVFSPYGFDEVELDGDKFVIIGEDMILAYEHKK